MPVLLKRAYDSPEENDGYRILVDRLWPRGVKKVEAALDEWLKEIAPSNELRVWFNHDPKRWGEFRHRYLVELKEHRETVRKIAKRASKGNVTLVFGARNEEENQAVVLQQYIKMLKPE